MDELIITDEHGILIKSYVALPKEQRPRVVYCPDWGRYADGDFGMEVADANLDAKAPEYANVIYADGSHGFLHAESLWFDFMDVLS